MKEKLRKVLLVLLCVGVLLYLLIGGVSDLINQKDLYTITIDGAAEVLEVEHSINGLIPIGKDYYYVGIEEETRQAYLLKASKRWFQKNFGEDHMALNPNGLTITALAKRVSDYEVARELEDRLTQLEELEFPAGIGYSLRVGYQTTALLKLFELVFILALARTGMPLFKAKGGEQNDLSPTQVKIWSAALVVCMLILIYVLR